MNANLLEVLQNANAIEILIKLLDEEKTGPHSTVSHEITTWASLRSIGTSGSIESHFPDLL
jgi:hypothetical protein